MFSFFAFQKMLAYRVESNKAGAEYQEQVLADWQTSKPSDNKEGCLLSQNIQVMKKEDILAGVCFKYKGDRYVIMENPNSGDLYINQYSSGTYYANISKIRNESMSVFGLFFGKVVTNTLYYKDLIKVA